MTHRGSQRNRAVLAACLLASVLIVVACDDDSGAASGQASPGEGTPTAQRTPQSPSGPTPTLNPEQAATIAAEIEDAPVLSDTPEPPWRAEGEPGAKLTAVCPVQVTGTPFANEGSLLLRGPDGQVARSSTTIYLEQSQTRPYFQGLLDDAAGCAQKLGQAWLASSLSFSASGTDPAVGEESFLVTGASGSPPAAAIFFRREEAIGVVLVTGTGSEESARGFAAQLDQQIRDKFEQLSGG